MSQAMDKQAFLTLILNQFTEHPEQKGGFVKRLLAGLHVNDPILGSDESTHQEGGVTIPSDVIKRILTGIDSGLEASTTTGEDMFFDSVNRGLYTSVKNALKEVFEASGNDYKAKSYAGEGGDEWWTNAYWNESIAKLLQIFAQGVDPDSFDVYEKSGLLIELEGEDEEKIDTSHLRATIGAHGAKAKLRVIDIIDADAGNSFENEADLYWYGNYYDRLIFKYNKIIKEGDTEKTETHQIGFTKVLFKEEANKTLGRINTGKEISKDELTQLIANIYSGAQDASNAAEITAYEKTSIKIITEGETYIFKVIKKPWVIPWYNFNGYTYAGVRGEDKKVSALTNPEKLGFTRKQSDEPFHWIRLIMPEYKRRVEVEDLNRNFWVIAQVIAGLSADLLDEDGPISSLIKGLMNEIGQLWENIIYLWLALTIVAEKPIYTDTHNEVVMLSDFSDNGYNYFKYDKKYVDNDAYVEANITAGLNYLVDMYPNRNLCILPVIRLNNYEHNYYGSILIPGIWVYDRNYNNDWTIYPIQISNNSNPGIKIDLSEFGDYIYGLREKEETYEYLHPLSYAADLFTEEDLRFYGLVRDIITINGEIYNPNVNNVSHTIGATIQLYDLARELVTEDKERNVVYSVSININKTLLHNTTNVSVLYDARNEGDALLPIEPISVPIEKGYYQGDLLSSCISVPHVVYGIQLLKTIKLKPTTNTQADVQANYSDISYQQMRSEDELVLLKVLNNYLDYKSDATSFWTQAREDKYSNGTYFFSLGTTPSQTEVNYSRNNVPISIGNQALAYPAIGDWKTVAESYYNTGTVNNTTIVFLEGQRDCDYINDNRPDVTGVTYFPYDSTFTDNINNTDGLPSSYSRSGAVSECNTGAVLSLPYKNGRTNSFYPHTSILPNHGINAALWTAIMKSGHSYLTTNDGYVSIDNIGAYDVDDVSVSTQNSFGEGTQWLVSIKKDDDEIKPNNWFVTKVTSHYIINPVYIDSNDQPMPYLNFCYPYRNHEQATSAELVHKQLARRVAIDEYNNNVDHTVAHIAQVIKDTFALNNIDDYNQEWYYDQAILRGRYDQWYVQQCKLYNIHGATWRTQAETYNITWGITGLSHSSHGIKDPEGNTFTDRIFIDAVIVAYIDIYGFGPGGMYAKKIYNRDSAGLFTSASTRYEETFDGKNLDEIREDYKVISNNNPQRNYEKYKSFYTARANNENTYNYEDDNYDPTWYESHIEWENTGELYYWDIPQSGVIN